MDLLENKDLAIEKILPKETKDVRNLKDIWAYYNDQLINQTKLYSDSKLKRMAFSLNKFTENYTDMSNTNFGVFVELKTCLTNNNLIT